MVDLSVARIRDELAAVPLAELIDVDDDDRQHLAIDEARDNGTFLSQVFVLRRPARRPAWAAFVESGAQDVQIRPRSSVSAVVLVRLVTDDAGQLARTYAVLFGAAGRHLLRPDAAQRGFGLRVVLNLLDPSGVDDASRVRALASKRRGATTVRSLTQSSDLADAHAHGVDVLQDVVGKATGQPHDTATWGQRVTGGDHVQVSRSLGFAELGDFCRRIEDVHARTDYRRNFGWIDNIQPVVEPDLVDQLTELVLGRLRGRDVTDVVLNAPEVVDWDTVTGFRFSVDPRASQRNTAVRRPDLRVEDLLTALAAKGQLADLQAGRLRSVRVVAVNGDDDPVHEWSMWKCLTAELVQAGDVYFLDEGVFFRVATDYLADLDAAVESIDLPTLALPPATRAMTEADYNDLAADDGGLVLMDKQLVRSSAGTSPVEVCDLLSSSGHLVHLKRHLHSKGLSHLFAQGTTSAELLQSDGDFRTAAHARVRQVANGNAAFDVLGADRFVAADFEVVYGIIGPWKGRSLSAALPFFSKVNLRRAVRDLSSRGFGVSVHRIDTT